MNDVFCKRREENSRDMSDRMMIVREHVDRLQGRYQLGKSILVICKHTSGAMPTVLVPHSIPLSDKQGRQLNTFY